LQSTQEPILTYVRMDLADLTVCNCLLPQQLLYWLKLTFSVILCYVSSSYATNVIN